MWLSPPNLTFLLVIVVLMKGSLQQSFNYKHCFPTTRTARGSAGGRARMSSPRLDKQRGAGSLQPGLNWALTLLKPLQEPDKDADPKDPQETGPGSQDPRASSWRGCMNSTSISAAFCQT